ncbi:hypothetical protein BKA65DRAFT_494467 [Rhexocercosporidium sp. MPI-PUGE-AT-0058]|nr:hypothetical protein BKA65DRAFT_494467 [Rhexocercosporidium sp. MPI-PUGE-AT-0058]
MLVLRLSLLLFFSHLATSPSVCTLGSSTRLWMHTLHAVDDDQTIFSTTNTRTPPPMIYICPPSCTMSFISLVIYRGI